MASSAYLRSSRAAGSLAILPTVWIRLMANRPRRWASAQCPSELIEGLRIGEGVDLIRPSVRKLLQEVIEVESSEVIGTARCLRARRYRHSALT